jgi:hypothetical protein
LTISSISKRLACVGGGWPGLYIVRPRVLYGVNAHNALRFLLGVSKPRE